MHCEAIPNNDGGQYAWRCTRVELDTGGDSSQALTGTQGASAGGAGGGGSATGRRGSASVRSNGSMARAASTGPSGGAAAGSSDRAKYNYAPPPVVSYTADVAMAVAANAVEGSGSAATAITDPPQSLKVAPFAKPTPELTEDERRRAENAVQQVAQYGDPSGVGARLLAKMGFGAVEGSKGGLGRNEQVRW